MPWFPRLPGPTRMGEARPLLLVSLPSPLRSSSPSICCELLRKPDFSVPPCLRGERFVCRAPLDRTGEGARPHMATAKQKGDPSGSPLKRIVNGLTRHPLRSRPATLSGPSLRQIALADLLAGCGNRWLEWPRSEQTRPRRSGG